MLNLLFGATSRLPPTPEQRLYKLAREHGFDPVVWDHLKAHEGLRLSPYEDPPGSGNWSIGYGHSEGVRKDSMSISRKDAEELLLEDIKEAVESLTRNAYGGWGKLNPVRRSVLVNLYVNLGAKLSEFRAFANLIFRERYASAALELLNSKYAKQVGGRATFLARAFMAGEWPVDHDGEYRINAKR